MSSPGLPRRRLLLAGVACVSAAGPGGIVWEASRPRAATLEAPVRRAAIWLAEVSFARPRVMAAAGGGSASLRHRVFIAAATWCRR